MENQHSCPKFKEFVDEHCKNLHDFAVKKNLPYGSLYRLYKGNRKPLRPLSKRICMMSDGRLTLKDFGFD
jgi:predicted transcriptional regulator